MKIKIIFFTIVGLVIVGLIIMKNFVPTKQLEQKVTQEGPTPTIEPRVASDDSSKKRYVEQTGQGLQIYFQRYGQAPDSLEELQAQNLGSAYIGTESMRGLTPVLTKIYPIYQKLPDDPKVCVVSMTLSTGEVLKAYCNPTIK